MDNAKHNGSIDKWKALLGSKNNCFSSKFFWIDWEEWYATIGIENSVNDDSNILEKC